MHQVVHRLADKGIAFEGRAEQVIAIDDRAVGRRESIGGVQVVEASDGAAARIKTSAAPDCSNTMSRPLAAGTWGLRRK